MSRRRVTHRPQTALDPRFNDPLVANFILRMMWNGKKMLTTNIFYNALDVVSKKISEDPLKCFHTVIQNVKPEIEVKSRRVGGSTYQVPIEVHEKRQEALAMRWIINAARQKKGSSMEVRLRNELLDAYNNTGTAVKKKEEIHRMAEANKAYSHYRW